ncbi:hypothetical protein ABPG74_000640 [Tetrahymena malaccensis]
MIIKYLAPIGMLIGGTILTIASSFQNKQVIDGQKYFHPFIQTFCYFLGESLCYIFYLFRVKKGSHEQETKPVSHNLQLDIQASSKLPLYGLYPAILDGIAMTLQYSSLTLVSPSVYQILRGGVIIVTAILSVTVLKRKLNFLNLVGLFVVLLGIVIVGGANLAFGIQQNKGNTSDSNDQIIGYTLIIVSLFANGMLFIQEEKIISSHKNIKPLDLVAFEGVWGVIYYSIFLGILSFIPCSGRFCVYQNSSSTQGTIESISVFFNQLQLNSYLLISQLIVLITIGFYAYSAVSVTKNLSAMVRSLIDVSRCLVVWIVGIVISIFSEQQWESFNPFGIILQTVGFLFIVVGSLIYNQIIFKKSKYGLSTTTQEFSLTLLDKHDQEHLGYHKLADHENKHKNHKNHHNNNHLNKTQKHPQNINNQQQQDISLPQFIKADQI